VDSADAVIGKLTITASSPGMIDGHILKLGFTNGGIVGTHNIEAKFTDLKLLNFWGDTVVAKEVPTAPGDHGINIFPSIKDVASVGTVGSYDKTGPGVGKVMVNTNPTYTVSGRVLVTTTDGTLVGVESEIELRDGIGVVATTKSLYDGTYSFPNIPNGAYSITVNKHAYNEHRSNFSVNNGNPNIPNIELVITTATISGVIYGDDGNPLAGATVQVVDAGFLPVGSPVSTDANGRYTVTAPLGNNYTVTAFLSGYGNSFGQDYGAGRGDLFNVSGNVSRDVTLSTKYSISGILTRTGGTNNVTTVPLYTVSLFDSSGSLISTISGDHVTSGNTVIRNFIFNNVPTGNNYYFEASYPGFITKRSPVFNVYDANVLRKSMNLDSASAPSAPTNVTALAGNQQATVMFTAPANNGGSPITHYNVISNPGNITVSGDTSPITLTGLTNGTQYTFTVRAVNIVGTGSASSASNPVIPSTESTDNSDITSAKALIESTVYGPATQSDVSIMSQAKAFVEARIATLNLNGVTAVVNDVHFLPATAGTFGNPGGIPGLYTFTASLSKGTGTPLTTIALTLNITATVYTIDPNNNAVINGKQINLNENASGDGWYWDAANNTLMLTGGDVGDIDITSGANCKIVAMNNTLASSIYMTGGGNLTIDVLTGKTLTANSTVGPAISSGGDLMIEGSGVVHAITSDPNAPAIESQAGSVTITDNVNVAVNANGGSAIKAAADVVISTTGKVAATTQDNGFALEAINAIIITNGTVDLFVSDSVNAFNIDPSISGKSKVSVNGDLIHGKRDIGGCGVVELSSVWLLILGIVFTLTKRSRRR
jgi:hypothetical protein